MNRKDAGNGGVSARALAGRPRIGDTRSVSADNVELVRGAYAHYQATGEFLIDVIAPDFVWDMSNFRDWPEQQVYAGIDGARRFMRDWLDAWDDWSFEVEALHDAGDKVVALVRQRGRSKASGLVVEMSFAQVWTLRNGQETRMEMYADPAEGLRAVGLAPGRRGALSPS